MHIWYGRIVSLTKLISHSDKMFRYFFCVPYKIRMLQVQQRLSTALPFHIRYIVFLLKKQPAYDHTDLIKQMQTSHVSSLGLQEFISYMIQFLFRVLIFWLFHSFCPSLLLVILLSLSPLVNSSIFCCCFIPLARKLRDLVIFRTVISSFYIYYCATVNFNYVLL